MSKKPNEALQSERTSWGRLYKVILNLGKLSEAICNHFTKDAYLPRFAGTVLGFSR